MDITITPNTVNGTIQIPTSKSYMQRALAAALLCNGTTTIGNPIFCDDTNSAIDCITKLGANVKIDNHELIVKGGLKKTNSQINCGESGLGIRIFSVLAALFNEEITINATGTLLNRPMEMICQALNQLNVKCTSTNNYAPLKIKGPLKAGTIKIDGSQGSQLLTGLLMVLPILTENSTIYVENLKSKPYIDMTLSLLSDFGIAIENENYKHFYIKGNQKYQACKYIVESDWSSAAPLLVAAATAGTANFLGLNINSKQADKAIIDALQKAGAEITFIDNMLIIKKANLNAFEFDANNCPDLFPPLVALAVSCNGTSIIKGVNRLKHKESNRGLVLQNEWRKLGVNIEILNDEMKIIGKNIDGGVVNSNNDHRIASAAAITALNSKNGITIKNTECINKSYPNFFVDLQSITDNSEQSTVNNEQ